MSGQYNVRIDASDLKRLSAKLGKCPMITRQATSSALNKTINRVIRKTKEEVSKEYSPLLRGIKQTAKIKKSNVATLQAEVKYTGSPIKAGDFKKSIPSNRYRSPVKLWIKKSAATSGSNPVMFGGHGKKGVFKRSLGSRDTTTVYTVSIPQMVSNDEVYQRVSDDAKKYLTDRLEHELDYRLGRL